MTPEEVLEKLALYFTSANSVEVEKATIRSSDFWQMTKEIIPEHYKNRIKND